MAGKSYVPNVLHFYRVINLLERVELCLRMKYNVDGTEGKFPRFLSWRIFQRSESHGGRINRNSFRWFNRKSYENWLVFDFSVLSREVLSVLTFDIQRVVLRAVVPGEKAKLSPVSGLTVLAEGHTSTSESITPAPPFPRARNYKNYRVHQEK